LHTLQLRTRRRRRGAQVLQLLESDHLIGKQPFTAGEITLCFLRERARLLELRIDLGLLDLREPLAAVPASLASYKLALTGDNKKLIYTYDTRSDHTGITSLLDDLRHAGIKFQDLQTTQSSLEDIFVGLVHKDSGAAQ